MVKKRKVRYQDPLASAKTMLQGIVKETRGRRHKNRWEDFSKQWTDLQLALGIHWKRRSTRKGGEIIWAPSSEFVSSSIPSWQTLTAHAQPFRGARDLAFCLKVPLDSLLVWASSEGSGETARMRRLAWTFAARIGDKYQIRLTRSILCLSYHLLSPDDPDWGSKGLRWDSVFCDSAVASNCHLTSTSVVRFQKPAGKMYLVTYQYND